MVRGVWQPKSSYLTHLAHVATFFFHVFYIFVISNYDYYSSWSDSASMFSSSICSDIAGPEPAMVWR